MLQVSDLTKRYGDNTILDGVSFVVNRGERVGLIGPNGCGKTTLLRCIMGEEAPDAGSVRVWPADLSVGYLAQGLAYRPGDSVGDLLQPADARQHGMEVEIERLGTEIAQAGANAPAELLEAYAGAVDALAAAGSPRSENELLGVLAGLGLDDLALDTPVDTLSGGQKTRLGLTIVLQSNPDLLLLDEPTNHLDIDTLEWLEEWVSRFRGAALIISHDRTFLDRTIHRVLELDAATHGLHEYAGNYSTYIETLEGRRAKQWEEWRDQETEIRRIRQDIARTRNQARSVELTTSPRQPGVRRYAKKVARKAASREKKLDRYLESDERVEKPKAGWQMKLEFGDLPASGQDVLMLEDVGMGFGGRMLFQHVTQTVRQGERVALIGPNGCGKTTLLRLITNQIAPAAGQIRLGSNVRAGYLAQEQETLEPALSAFEAVRAVAALDRTEALSFLHYFLFAGDDAFLPIKRLSYGERARLSLALLVARGCNFLLLDEPINHLDVPSRERFEQAMRAYEGAVLAVVHDRFFIERFATSVWAMEGQMVRSYVDLDEWRRLRRRYAPSR